MPLFAIICRDNPGMLQTRIDTREAHLTFLRDFAGLRMAGPLIEEGEMRGSLLVIEAEDLAAARDWAAGDPYKSAGLFASAEVIEWKKVIG
ncbi:MAG: YciI family protein [Paracoccus sp. (in: a-proteobacteria)]|nr:YciI family protein [Paracoccus sp. (in: a-proteobacteria)]